MILKKATIFLLPFLFLACQSNEELHIIFAKVNGLQTGNQVQCNGMPIGKVTAINLIDNGQNVLVALEINTDIRIPKNSTFEIRHADLLGTKIIDVSSGNSPVYLTALDTVYGEFEELNGDVIKSNVLEVVDHLLDEPGFGNSSAANETTTKD